MMYHNQKAFELRTRGIAVSSCRVYGWEVRRIWEPSALRSDLPPLIPPCASPYAIALSRPTRNIRTRSANVEYPSHGNRRVISFFSFYLFIYFNF
jgi:hypothetical protein